MIAAAAASRRLSGNNRSARPLLIASRSISWRGQPASGDYCRPEGRGALSPTARMLRPRYVPHTAHAWCDGRGLRHCGHGTRLAVGIPMCALRLRFRDVECFFLGRGAKVNSLLFPWMRLRLVAAIYCPRQHRSCIPENSSLRHSWRRDRRSSASREASKTLTSEDTGASPRSDPVRSLLRLETCPAVLQSAPVRLC